MSGTALAMKPGPGSASAPLGGVLAGASYGALGLPLAFVALPLNVVLPNHYASEFGVPLAWLGVVLLGARLFDALADPLIGRWADGLCARSSVSAWLATAAAAVLLALGFRALFFPMVQGSATLLAWCAALLAVTYLGYSVISVNTRPGVRGSAATRHSARASLPGARDWRCSACCWPACCPRWRGWAQARWCPPRCCCSAWPGCGARRGPTRTAPPLPRFR